jgi:hypothetical protein
MRKIRELEGGCWEWTGPRYSTACGRGRFKLGRRGVPPDRAGWEVFRGERLPGDVVLMKECGQSWCVRPEHVRPDPRRSKRRGISK